MSALREADNQSRGDNLEFSVHRLLFLIVARYRIYGRPIVTCQSPKSTLWFRANSPIPLKHHIELLVEASLKHKRVGINPNVPPSGAGCVECLTSGGWWLHLRRCTECGHIGCCDSSPSQHASTHFQATGHPIIASFEPGESWFYDYRSQDFIPENTLAEPRWHPAEQSVPGPTGKVPRNWESQLN